MNTNRYWAEYTLVDSSPDFPNAPKTLMVEKAAVRELQPIIATKEGIYVINPKDLPELNPA